MKFACLKTSIGQNIRRIRRSKDLTQENMAFELGITKSAYSKIERGETNPSVNRLFDISKILEVDITEFFHNTDAEHLAGEEEENLYNPTIREEIEALNKALLTMNQRHTQEINNLSTAFLSLLKRLQPEENQ